MKAAAMDPERLAKLREFIDPASAEAELLADRDHHAARADEAEAKLAAVDKQFTELWAEWWGDRGDYYKANQDKWLADAERVCRHWWTTASAERAAADEDEQLGAALRKLSAAAYNDPDKAAKGFEYYAGYLVRLASDDAFVARYTEHTPRRVQVIVDDDAVAGVIEHVVEFVTGEKAPTSALLDDTTDGEPITDASMPSMNLHQDTFGDSSCAFDRCAAAVELGWQVVSVGIDPDLSHPANSAVIPSNGRHGPAGVTWLVWIASPLGPDEARARLDEVVRKSCPEKLTSAEVEEMRQLRASAPTIIDYDPCCGECTEGYTAKSRWAICKCASVAKGVTTERSQAGIL